MKQRRRPPLSEINVVPYIDVMLVLLIIFMVTAPLTHQGIEVDLPSVVESDVPDLNERTLIFVDIDRQGALFIHLAEESPLGVNRTELASRVAVLMASYPEAMVLVRGDRLTPYGQVMEALSALRQAGVAKPLLATELAGAGGAISSADAPAVGDNDGA